MSDKQPSKTVSKQPHFSNKVTLGFAIVGLVCTIASNLALFGIIFSVGALIRSIQTLRSAPRNKLIITSLIISSISCLILIVTIVFAVLAISLSPKTA